MNDSCTPNRCPVFCGGKYSLVLAALLAAGALGLLGYRLWEPSQRGPAGSPTSRALAADRAGGVLGAFDTTNLKLDPQRILSGGPPKDGIPSLTIDEPNSPLLTSADRAAYLEPGSRLVAVTVNGHTRGYPLAVLNWHECVNDKLGGVPIAIIYCPLCDSVSVVDRRIGEKVLEFGISGLLYNSNVLLYDRTDQALWSQVKMQAVSGPHAGQSLRHLDNWRIMHFDRFKAEHAGARVLSEQTGYSRDYSRNPYGDYFTSPDLMFPVHGADNRLPTKARVVGVRVGEASRAYPVSAIVAEGRIDDELAGHSIKLAADANHAVHVVDVPDDAQVVHTFYFAWSAFHPETAIYEPR